MTCYSVKFVQKNNKPPYQAELFVQVCVNRIPKTFGTHVFCLKITHKLGCFYANGLFL